MDKDVDFVKVYSFDLSKAFDFVSNQILCNKLKLYNMRMINFLSNHKQRVVVNSVTTKFVDIDILRICKYYRYTLEELTILFHKLIVSVFTYAIEVWACAYCGKHLSKIDKFCKRAMKYGYSKECMFISDVIQIKDEQLWKKITATHTCSLTDLLANQPTYQSLRQCGDDYILPRIRTGCFKSCFANRSLFTFI